VFGMKVIAYDPYAKAAPAGVTLCSLEELYRDAHVVSLHCPLTADNRNMINRDSIALMRDGAIIVNTARGGLIDEADLLEALNSGKLRSAGLDSFQTEPLATGHAFANVRNAILSPHIGGVTGDAYIGMGTGAAANVLAVLGAAATA